MYDRTIFPLIHSGHAFQLCCASRCSLTILYRPLFVARAIRHGYILSIGAHFSSHIGDCGIESFHLQAEVRALLRNLRALWAGPHPPLFPSRSPPEGTRRSEIALHTWRGSDLGSSEGIAVVADFLGWQSLAIFSPPDAWAASGPKRTQPLPVVTLRFSFIHFFDFFVIPPNY